MPETPLKNDQVDEEISQALARLAICIAALLYLAGLWLSNRPPKPLLLYGLTIYTALSLFWLAWVKRAPNRQAWRRTAIIFGDLSINTFFFFLLGPTGVVFYPFYLWIVVGNGMRFGPRPLVIALVSSVCFFVGTLYFSDYWRGQLPMGIGLLIGLIILPIFYLKLIKRLHEANAQLQIELSRSQEAARAKSRFLANMSHELRTPMNGILGLSRMMKETPLDRGQQEWMDLIHESTTTLLQVINDILDFSKIDAEKLTLESRPFHLRELIFSVYSLLNEQAKDKGIELDARLPSPAPDFFLGDSTRIRQILFNLVGNAIKFTEKGKVDIRYRWSPLSGGSVRVQIEIRDTGIGIPADKLETIFEHFEQVDTRSSRLYGGSGLGLAISKRLALLMGGDIEVVSELGAGSTFTLSLPLAPAKEPPADKRRRHDTPIEGKPRYLALLVEDDRVSQMVATGQLRKLGIAVEAAFDGLEALRRLETHEYDLIFMDIQMPNLDGLEATRRIRRMAGEKARIPIVALTANASVQDQAECRAAGMDEHVKKPITPKDLAAAVASLIAAKRLPTESGANRAPGQRRHLDVNID